MMTTNTPAFVCYDSVTDNLLLIGLDSYIVYLIISHAAESRSYYFYCGCVSIWFFPSEWLE